MSKFQELVNGLCPNGVEYRLIKNIVKVNRGKRLTKSQLDNDAEYEVYHGSKDTILGKYHDFNAPENTTIIVNTGGIGGVKFLDRKFWCSDGSFWLGKSEDVNDKFLYYCLAGYEEYFSSKRRVGGVPTIDRSVIEEFEIPLPPLPVQEEIVKILDKMTDYVTELKAELKARKMQYEYYRDDLLAFDSSAPKGKLQGLIKELCLDGVEHKPLKDVTILNGLKQVSAEKLFSLNTFSGEIKLLPSSSNYDWYCEETKELNEYLYEDEVITLGRARNANIKYHNGKFIASQNHIVRSKNKRELNTKYLYYFLSSSAQNFYTTQSNYPLFNKNDFNNCKIPVPPLPVQEEIVRILDKFNSICNDVSTGLPAEIEARQKQYEYYRDKLLSFQKLENEEC